MLALPDGFLRAVGPSLIFMKPVVVGAPPYIIAHVHVDKMIGIERVLVTKHDVCATGIATFTHIIDISDPLPRHIAKVSGCRTSPFVSERSDCTQVNIIPVIRSEIRTQTKEYAVFMLLAIAVRVEICSIVITAARCRASGYMLGFKSDTGE